MSNYWIKKRGRTKSLDYNLEMKKGMMGVKIP